MKKLSTVACVTVTAMDEKQRNPWYRISLLQHIKNGIFALALLPSAR